MSRSVTEITVVDENARWLPGRDGGVQVVVPLECPVDQKLHVDDAMRCIALVAREGCHLVVTLSCGCPLIAVQHRSGL